MYHIAEKDGTTSRCQGHDQAMNFWAPVHLCFFVGDEHLPEVWGILYNYKDFVTNHDFMRCKKVV